MLIEKRLSTTIVQMLMLSLIISSTPEAKAARDAKDTQSSLAAQAQDSQMVVDDTLIVVTQKYVDMTQVRQTLESAGTRIVDIVPIKNQYSLVYVKPTAAKAGDTMTNVLNADAQHKLIKSITRNYKIEAADVPDDPSYDAQWNLPDMNWDCAFNTYASMQTTVPHITILDTGLAVDNDKNELERAVQY